MTHTLLSNFGLDENEVRCCPECGAKEVRVAVENSTNPTHGESVVLKVEFPLWTCARCGFAYTDGRGMEIIENATLSFLGRRLSPDEIRSIRESYGMSRVEFGRLTGYGHKSIERWELGKVRQNASADRFLRLLDDKEVAEKMRLLDHRIRQVQRE